MSGLVVLKQVLWESLLWHHASSLLWPEQVLCQIYWISLGHGDNSQIWQANNAAFLSLSLLITACLFSLVHVFCSVPLLCTTFVLYWCVLLLLHKTSFWPFSFLTFLFFLTLQMEPVVKLVNSFLYTSHFALTLHYSVFQHVPLRPNPNSSLCPIPPCAFSQSSVILI